MSQLITLNEIEVEEISTLVKEKRLSLGYVETPIANDLFIILDKLEIELLEYPIKTEKQKPAFSAALIYSTVEDKNLAFIGINTTDYFDKQLFAIAHELYHFFTKTPSHLSRLSKEDNIIEIKANRFAAEFLLPERILKSIILKIFKTSNLTNIQTKTLLRFIARLQCDWYLPYRSIVKRLKEINAISSNQYALLYKIDERDIDGEYARMAMGLNKEIFQKLNKPTNNIGTSSKNIDIIIRNYEDNLIDEDQLNNTLNLFGKSSEDFGYKIEVATEDIDEFEQFFNEEDDDED